MSAARHPAVLPVEEGFPTSDGGYSLPSGIQLHPSAHQRPEGAMGSVWKAQGWPCLGQEAGEEDFPEQETVEWVKRPGGRGAVSAPTRRAL